MKQFYFLKLTLRILFLSFSVLALDSFAFGQTAFDPASTLAYQVSFGSGTTSTLYSYNVSSGTSSTMGAVTVSGTAIQVNGVGYSNVDNFIWGAVITSSSSSIVKIVPRVRRPFIR